MTEKVNTHHSQATSNQIAGNRNSSQQKSGRIEEVEIDQDMFEVYDLAVVHERRVAIHDLCVANNFNLRWDGPYRVFITRTETRLILQFSAVNGEGGENLQLSISRMRNRLSEYRRVCEDYFEAIRGAPVARIEALDVGRRTLHDENSEYIQELFGQRVIMDLDTARKIYTLIVALFANTDRNTSSTGAY